MQYITCGLVSAWMPLPKAYKAETEREDGMSENTYLEQYIAQAHILPHKLNDRLMESLKEVKDPKNERRIKKIHNYINYIENNGEKLTLYQKASFEIMVINYKYMMERRVNNERT